MAVNGFPDRRTYNGRAMNAPIKQLVVSAMLVLCAASTAHGDIWRWTDANGKVHFVNTLNTIYTWVDEDGRVNFSDTPDHEDAVSVDLVWHSEGDSVEEAEQAAESSEKDDGWADPHETAEERIEREQAEAYYCKNAQQIHASYLKAPRLFRTTESGDREFLSDEEIESTLAETQARVDELCN